MLLNAIRNGDLRTSLITFLLAMPVILISLTVHELCHGYAAYKLGDPTARNLGRLTLNPLKHLDPVGTLMMLIVGFGWAKPVPVNTRYFRNPKRDMALTALAGPVSNLILAFFGFMIFRAVEANVTVTVANYDFLTVVITFLYLFYNMNIYLAVFNLIPIPPLDGSRILFVLLPTKAYFGVMKYERVIYAVVILLLFMGALTGPLGVVAGLVEKLFSLIADLIPFFH